MITATMMTMVRLNAEDKVCPLLYMRSPQTLVKIFNSPYIEVHSTLDIQPFLPLKSAVYFMI